MKKKIIVSVLALLMFTGCAMPEISFENADSPLFVHNGVEDSERDQSASGQTVKDESGKTAPEDSGQTANTANTAVPASADSNAEKSDSDASSETAGKTDQSTVSENSAVKPGEKEDDSSASSDSVSHTESGSDKKNEKENPAAFMAEPQQLTMKTYSFSDYSYGSNTASVRYEWLRLDDDSKELCPDLDEALKKQESLLKKNMRRAFNDLDDAAQKTSGKNAAKYSISQNVIPVRADNQVLSALSITLENRGKKSDFSYQTMNLDSQSGTEIELSDIIETEDLPDLLVKSYQDIYPDEPVSGFEKAVSEYGDEDYIWAVSGDGLCFYFTGDSEGELVTVPLLRNRNKRLFTDVYEEVPESWALPISESFVTVFDRLGDGRADLLSVSLNSAKGAVTVNLNDESFTGRFEANEIMPVLVRTAEEGYYIYVECRLDNDYRQIAVLDISEEKPVYLGIVGNAGFPILYDADKEISELKFPGNPESFTLAERNDLLSSYSGNRLYRTGPDGMPEAQSEWCYTVGELELTSRMDFTADIVDPRTDRIISQGAKIAKGTKMTIFRTDGKSIVDLETEDDEVIRVDVDTSGGWPQTIDGTSIEKLFDGIRFAG